MVGQRLKGYIQSFGLEAADVPKVVASFMAAKYTTWGVFVVLGVRYQPLRCLARPRQQPSWFRRNHLRFLSAWNRAKQQYGGGQLRRSHSQRLCNGQRSSNGNQRLASKAALPARRRWREAVRSSFAKNLVKAKDALHRARSSSWYGWASDKYWYLSDKLAASAQKSSLWSGVSSTLRVNPSNLALGFAEGTILYKLTFVLTAPLELWLIVKLFQQHRAVLSAAEAPQRQVEEVSVEVEAPGRPAAVAAPKDEEEEVREDTYMWYLAHAIPWMEGVLAATADVDDLSSHVQ